MQPQANLLITTLLKNTGSRVTGYCAGNRCFAKSNMRKKHQKALPVSITGMVLRIFRIAIPGFFSFWHIGF